MKETGRSKVQEQTRQEQRPLPLKEFARQALWDTVVLSGLAFVEEQLEAERTVLCGPRYAHQAQREAVRTGRVPSSLALGGRRVKVERPRARSTAGHELSLPSWRAWSTRDPLNERAFEQMVLGVSTRRYARSLEPLPHEAAVHGIGKSAVSERFVAGTKRKLDELMRRDLSGLGLAALMIDGVRFAEHVILAAIGIDQHGRKHVLGLREGATENAAAVRALLADLIERGLDGDHCLLVVIDGAKALRKAVGEVFGRRALIQRCQAHKRRNVLEALPERLRPETHRALNRAYAADDVKRARRLLEHLAQQLENAHPGAAASLREGLDETLTVMRLKLPRGLARVLSSTNLIENLFSRVREISRRVRHWQGGAMALRWTAAGVLEAERGFRRVVGCEAMPKLLAALRAHDRSIDRIEGGIDAADKVA